MLMCSFREKNGYFRTMSDLSLTLTFFVSMAGDVVLFKSPKKLQIKGPDLS